MYVYIQSEKRLWTAGFYDPNGKWHPESDHDDPENAAERVAWLNGETEYKSAVALNAVTAMKARITERAAYIEDRDRTIAAQNARIESLTTSHKEIARDQLAIAQLLTDCGIEHSGYKKQAERVAMLIERLRTSQQSVTKLAAANTTIEAAAQSEWCEGCNLPADHCRENQCLDATPEATGSDYAEGCAP